jgi:hypothetical protein
MLRRFVIGIAVLVGLLVAADFGARLYSERVVGDEIQSSLELSTRPSVTFDGWPFVTHMLSGDLPEATISAKGFQDQGVRLSTVSVTLHDLHFTSMRLISRGGGVIRAKTGTGTAVLTAVDLNATLRSEGLPLSVSFRPGHASVGAHGVSIPLGVALDGNTLVLTPGSVDAASARVGLPVLVRGMRYTDLRVKKDEIELSAKLRNVTFLVPG